jgi:hypothetical protein
MFEDRYINVVTKMCNNKNCRNWIYQCDCKTSAFGCKLCQMLGVAQCFNKHCSWHLQGELLFGRFWQPNVQLHQSDSLHQKSYPTLGCQKLPTNTYSPRWCNCNVCQNIDNQQSMQLSPQMWKFYIALQLQKPKNKQSAWLFLLFVTHYFFYPQNNLCPTVLRKKIPLAASLSDQ